MIKRRKKFNQLVNPETVEFKKLLRSLRKYCPQSFTDFCTKVFQEQYFSKLEDGIHKIELFTTEEFKFVYGQIYVIVEVKNLKYKFKSIEPRSFFVDGYIYELSTYRRIYYRNQKDKFKIDLMFDLKKRSKHYGKKI